MKELLDKLEGMTLLHALLIGMGLTIGYYFLFFDNGEVLMADLQRVQEEVSAKRAVAVETRTNLEEGEKFKKELETMSSQYQQALMFLPSESDITDLLRQVTQQVRSTGASIVKIEPLELTGSKGVYEEFYIDIELRGKFAELTLALAYLSKIPRIINVKGFEMKNPDEKAEVPILTFKGQIIGYKYMGKP